MKFSICYILKQYPKIVPYISCYTLSSLCTSTLSYSQDQDGEGEPRFSSGSNQTEGSRTTCDSTGEYQVRESGKLGGKEGREEEVGEKGGGGGRKWG